MNGMWQASAFEQGEYFRTFPYEIAAHNFMQSNIAVVIESSFNKLSEKCAHRVVDGLYITVLEKYYELLSRYKRSDKEAHGYYYEMKNLIIPVLQEVLNIGGVQNGQE